MNIWREIKEGCVTYWQTFWWVFRKLWWLLLAIAIFLFICDLAQ